MFPILLMLACLSTSAWGQLLIPLETSSTQRQTLHPETRWLESMQLTPDMSAKPTMQIIPANIPEPKAKPVRRATKKPDVTKKKKKKKKEESFFSQIPIIPQIPKLLDGTKENLTDSLVGLADNVDSFFGEKRADDELNRSRIRLSYAYTVFHERRPVDDYAVRINLRFPKLEERAKSWIGIKPKKKKKKKKKNSDVNPETAAASERRRKKEKNPWLFRTDVGGSVAYPPIFFTRARLRKNWDLPFFIQRFTEELAWVSDRGVIQTTTLNYDTEVKSNLLFRFVNEQDWEMVPKEFTTQHGPGLIHKISPDDGISYNFRVKTVVNGPWYMTGYGINMRYRRNLRNQWLYGEIGPALDFPKSQSFRRVASFLIRIESLFGER